MAIYRFSAQMISRSTGRSATAAAAYRSANRIVDERQGLEHDYSKRSGVLHSEIILPDNAPDWMADRSQLWNAVEQIERRKDAQLSREVTLALPHELNDDQRRDLVHSFVQEQFTSRGMVADVALHAPGRIGDQRNHHAHVMLTTRSIEGDSFGGKDRSWNAKDLLEGWRVGWEQSVNRDLERHGFDERVDHRSLVDRRDEALEREAAAIERGDEEQAMQHKIEAMAFDRDPQPHIGWKAWAMEMRGIRTIAGDALREVRAQIAVVREMVEPLRERVLAFVEAAREVVAEVVRDPDDWLNEAPVLPRGAQPLSQALEGFDDRSFEAELEGVDFTKFARDREHEEAQRIEAERRERERLEQERLERERVLEQQREAERQKEAERVKEMEREREVEAKRERDLDMDWDAW